MIPTQYNYKVNIVDDRLIASSEVVVHTFEVDSYGDDDPVLAAGEPLDKWGQSEVGRWVKEHSLEAPRWKRFSNPNIFSERFVIIARLTEKDQTYFRLKFK